MLYALLALVTAVLTVGSIYRYISVAENTLYIVAAIIFAILTVVFGSLFLSGRINRTEDIHITE
jgi:CDP-diglyceride synthetase